MMQAIDSDALGILTKSLGLSGVGSQITELADGVVDQVLEVGQLARRGRTQTDIQGIYTPIFRNAHTGSTSISNAINPYNAGTTFLVAPYPDPVPPQFDIYLVGASLRVVSGTPSGLTVATLSLTVGTKSQGWGRTDAGAQVLVSQAMRLAFWDATVSDGTFFGILNGARGAHQRIGLRLPRGGGGSVLTFRSTSSVTVSIDCQIILGLFPVALGQDVIF